MPKKRLLFAVALTVLAGCGAAHSTPAAAPSPQPVQACLQLHDWQLHNHGQGISRAFQHRLEIETNNTQLGTDIVQWLQDLHAPLPSPSNVVQQVTQLAQDAKAVALDCVGYGVRHTLPG